MVAGRNWGRGRSRVNGDDQGVWHSNAVFRTADPDELFVDGTAQNTAEVLCTGCPGRTECLAHALDHRIKR
ncbi:WhiB family transcriptional regulator [Streptomyces sp. NPDC057249]|uniref:WhiB family transcriptional regulator n=1 Tax=Streptomyces sp. NPDC057249 TaxID=3346067 RepID=UPI0036367383